MPRPRKIIPSSALKLKLPSDLRAQLDLQLFSPLEGRVPLGAYAELFTKLLLAHLQGASLDVAPFTGLPPGSIVTGPKHVIRELKRSLSHALPTA